MANPVRELFDPKPAAARVVLVDTNGDIYNATGGSGGGDVNITEIGGNPVGTTLPVSAVNLDIRDLAFATDKVDVTGSTVAITGTVTIAEPVTVDAVDLDIRNLVFATDKVDVTGSAITVSGTVTVSAVDLDIRNLVFATDKVDISGSTSVGVTGPLTDTQLRATPVPVSGTVSVTEPVTVDAVDLDIRNLVFATDKVDASGTTLGANSGVDIGDVTINNAAGASAVNIQDGGNTITVDGTVSVNLNAGTNTNEVVGDVAHDQPNAGNPVLVAASAETMADSAPANRVSADGDATRLSATDGAVFVIPTGPQTWTFHEDSSSALTDTVVHTAPSAGLSLYVTDIAFSTGAATPWNIFFEQGTTTTVLGPWYLEAVAGRGAAIHFGTPKKIPAATSLTVTTSAAIAHSIDIQGFIAPG